MRVYKFSLTFGEYVKLISIVSNLAIDPIVAEESNSRQMDISGILTYEVVRIGGHKMLKPVILLYPHPHVHIRLSVLEYMLTHMLGIGSGDIGRLALRRIEEEVVPHQALVPHLDARLRRIVIAKEMFENVTNIFIKKWFTLVSAVAGLHRWGFAWRRIIASTLAGYQALLSESVNSDIDLVASSFAEFIVNRAILYEVGEERYLHPEIYAALRVLIDQAREHITSGNIEEAFIEIQNVVYQKLVNDNECVKKMIDGNIERCNAEFLGVYVKGLRTLNTVLEKMQKDDRVCKVIVVFATETWSPIYLLHLLHNLGSGDKLLRPLILLLHTPDSTPQVLFSLMIFKDVGERLNNRVSVEEIRETAGIPLKLYGCKIHSPQLYIVEKNNNVVMSVLPLPILPYNPQLAFTFAKAALLLSAAGVTQYAGMCRYLRVYIPAFFAGMPLNAIAFSKLRGRRIEIPYAQLNVDIAFV